MPPKMTVDWPNSQKLDGAKWRVDKASQAKSAAIKIASVHQASGGITVVLVKSNDCGLIGSSRQTAGLGSGQLLYVPSPKQFV